MATDKMTLGVVGVAGGDFIPGNGKKLGERSFPRNTYS